MATGLALAPFWWLPVNSLTVLLLVGLGVFMHLRRPPASLWNPMRGMAVCALIWVVGDIACLFTPNVDAKQAALGFLYLGTGFLAPFWWLLCVRYAELFDIRVRWLRPWMKTVPFHIAGVFWLAALSNSWHGQFVTAVAAGRNVHQWMFTASTSFILIDCIAILGISAEMSRPSRVQIVRRTGGTMLIGAVVALLSVVVQVVLDPPWPVDIPLLGCGVIVAMCVFSIYRSRLFHLSPVTLREVFQNDPEGVVVLDQEGRLRFSNPAAERLLPAASFAPETHLLEELAPLLMRPAGDDRPVTPAELRREVIGGPPAGRIYFDRSGSRRALHFSASQIRSRWGRRTSHCLRVQDATALTQMDRQRRELGAEVQRIERLRSLGILAGGIAHEINNPIGSITMASEFALLCQDDPNAVREGLETVLREARRCGEIVGGVLRFARDEASPRWLASINDSVLQARDHAMSWGGEKQLDLVLDLDASIRPILLNPTEIEQVLSNLLRNAVQAGGTRTQVTVETLATPRGVRMTVRDNGPGMSDEELEHAFEPFYTSRASGTGLGLSIVHGIVAGHGGELSIANASAGGMVVTIDLPAAVDATGQEGAVTDRAR